MFWNNDLYVPSTAATISSALHTLFRRLQETRTHVLYAPYGAIYATSDKPSN